MQQSVIGKTLSQATKILAENKIEIDSVVKQSSGPAEFDATLVISCTIVNGRAKICLGDFKLNL